jgi:hypothetical protein
MSGNQKGRAPAELWSLVQAIVWIERHAGVPEHPIHRRIALARVQELYKALKAGMITASGCVDGGERRDISPGEWNDYRLKLKHTVFAGHYFVGTAETPIKLCKIAHPEIEVNKSNNSVGRSFSKPRQYGRGTEVFGSGLSIRQRGEDLRFQC